MENDQKQAIIAEYFRGGKSYRDLGKKYGVSQTAIYKWVKAVKPPNQRMARKRKEENGPVSTQQMSTEVEALQAELLKTKLQNKLLSAMLDIGKEQYGIDLRKKSGTKRS